MNNQQALAVAGSTVPQPRMGSRHLQMITSNVSCRIKCEKRECVRRASVPVDVRRMVATDGLALHK